MGICFCSFIEPSEGYALDTEFRVACSGWMDQDLPLSYKFAYKTTEEDFEQLIYFGSKSETPPVKLPLGKPHLNYSVSVIVDAADSFLAPEVVILNVTVSEKKTALKFPFISFINIAFKKCHLILKMCYM